MIWLSYARVRLKPVYQGFHFKDNLANRAVSCIRELSLATSFLKDSKLKFKTFVDTTFLTFRKVWLKVAISSTELDFPPAVFEANTGSK